MLDFKEVNSLPYLYDTYKLLKPLSAYYPSFKDWYWDNVVTGILSGKDKLIVMEKNNIIAGVAILKDREEKKLNMNLMVHKT